MEENEYPYIKEINALERKSNGDNASFTPIRWGHYAIIEYLINSADVNLNPSRSEQYKKFEVPANKQSYEN